MNLRSESSNNSYRKAAQALTAICVLACNPVSTTADDRTRIDDAQFVRRASVVLTGRTLSQALTASTASTAIVDGSLNREHLVDQLLSSPNYSESWGRWLAILTGCEEEPLSTAAFAMKVPRERIFWLWQTWTQEQLKHDKPFTEIIHEIIATDSRSEDESYRQYQLRHDALVSSLKADFDDGDFLELSSNDLFWKTNRAAEQNAELIARNLLGFRLECAKCHDHPFTHWTMDDHKSFGAVFQRAVYAELPIKPTEKYSLLAWVVATGAILSLILLCGSFWLLANARSKLALAANVLSATSIALGLYVVTSFRHVLLGTTTGKPIELATKVAEATGGSQLLMAVLAASLLGMAYYEVSWFRHSSAQRPIKRLSRNFAMFVIIAFMSLLTIDVAFANADTAKGNGRTLLFVAKRELMHALELGGQGQQIREVYDDSNGNFTRLGIPKAIDGPLLSDAADSHPRRELADWLISEPSHQLSRNIINRIAMRVFGIAFVDPVDDYRPDSLRADAAYFEELVAGFRSHDHSLKWLLKKMVLSDRFQTRPEDSPRGITFQPRALRGEEIVASLNQLTSSKIHLAKKWSPQTDNPFTCGTAAPNRSELGDRILNAAQRADSDLDVPFEVVSIITLDQSFQQHLKLMWAELVNKTGSVPTAIELAAENLWGKRMNAEQMRLLKHSTQQQPSDALWAIVNSPRFLILD